MPKGGTDPNSPQGMGLVFNSQLGAWIDPDEEPNEWGYQTTWSYGGGPSGTNLVRTEPQDLTYSTSGNWGDVLSGLAVSPLEAAVDIGSQTGPFVQENILDPIGSVVDANLTPYLDEILGGGTAQEDILEDVIGAGETVAGGITEPLGGVDEEEDEDEEIIPGDDGGGFPGFPGGGVRGTESEFEISEGISPYAKSKLYGPQQLRPYDFARGNLPPGGNMPQNQLGLGTVDPGIQSSVMMAGRGGGISPFAAGNAWGQWGPTRTGRGFY